jgi:hypothetical protein
LCALSLVWSTWLQALHSIGLVVNDNVFFVLFRRRIIGSRQFLTKDGVEIRLNVVFRAHVVVIVIVVRCLLGD